VVQRGESGQAVTPNYIARRRAAFHAVLLDRVAQAHSRFLHEKVREREIIHVRQ
jgi:hypothetical protein